MKFEYLPVGFLHPNTNKVGFIYRPYIPIRLGYSHKLSTHPVNCLLDSGADKNLFPSQWGELVGIKIKNGKLQEHIGIGEVSVLAYRHTVILYVGSHSFKTEVDFSEQQQLPLLGRDGFFRLFKKVSFDEQNRIVRLDY